MESKLNVEHAIKCLIEEFQKGWESGEKDGWIALDEVELQLGIADK